MNRPRSVPCTDRPPGASQGMPRSLLIRSLSENRHTIGTHCVSERAGGRRPGVRRLLRRQGNRDSHPADSNRRPTDYESVGRRFESAGYAAHGRPRAELSAFHAAARSPCASTAVLSRCLDPPRGVLRSAPPASQVRRTGRGQAFSTRPRLQRPPRPYRYAGITSLANCSKTSKLYGERVSTKWLTPAATKASICRRTSSTDPSSIQLRASSSLMPW